MFSFKFLYTLGMTFVVSVFSLYLPAHAIPPETENTALPMLASSMVKGNYGNGISFTILPSSDLKEGAWIKCSFSNSMETDDPVVVQLMRQASFYGTETLDRLTIENSLNDFGLDIDADSFWQFDECGENLEFCLMNSDEQNLQNALYLMHQLLFYPTLSDQEIELARLHLLEGFESCVKDEVKNEKIQCLMAITPENIREYYSSWMQEQNISFTIVGNVDTNGMETTLNQIFETSSSLAIIQDHQSTDLSRSLLQSIKLGGQDNKSWIIDGKIWMNQPNWMNKQRNGRGLGTLLTIGGIAGIASAAVVGPAAVPAAVIAGGISATTGIYLLCKNYFKDPSYLDSKRQIDLSQGTANAYKNGRAGLTLTPLERRYLFLQEMVYQPERLAGKPILLLADMYRLNDPVISEMFTQDEYNFLLKFKSDFIHHRNHFKMLKRALENELASVLTPYGLIRTGSIELAQQQFNHNYFVQTKKSTEADRDKRLNDIKLLFENEQITQEEKEALTQETKEYYAAYYATPEFSDGYSRAQNTLSYAKNEAEALYALQVEQCKLAIGYHQRMAEFKDGKNSLIHYANRDLIDYLRNFPPTLSALPDYLDLRSL